MDFFGIDESEIYKNNTTTKGLYPISNNALWHSGIHFYSDGLIKNPVSGLCIADNIFEDNNYESNYIVLKHTDSFGKENDSIVYYILIKNFNIRKEFEKFIDSKNKFGNFNLKVINDYKEIEKLKEIPFCYKFMIDYDGTESNSDFFNDILYNYGTNKIYDMNFIQINSNNYFYYKIKDIDKAYIKNETKFYSKNAICMGNLKDKITLNCKYEKYTEINGEKYYSIPVSQNKNAQLDNDKKITGYFFRNNEPFKHDGESLAITENKTARNDVLFVEKKSSPSISKFYYYLITEKEIEKLLNNKSLYSSEFVLEIDKIKKEILKYKEVILLPFAPFFYMLKRNPLIDEYSFYNLKQEIASKNICFLPNKPNLTQNNDYIADFSVKNSKKYIYNCNSKLFFKICYEIALLNDEFKDLKKKICYTKSEIVLNSKDDFFYKTLDSYTTPHNPLIIPNTNISLVPPQNSEMEIVEELFSVLKKFIKKNMTNNVILVTEYDKVSLKDKYENFYDILKIAVNDKTHNNDVFKENACYYVTTDHYNTENFEVQIKQSDVYFVKRTAHDLDHLESAFYYNSYIFPSSSITKTEENCKIPLSAKSRCVKENGEIFELLNYKEVLTQYLNANQFYNLAVKDTDGKTGIIFVTRKKLEEVLFYLEKINNNDKKNPKEKEKIFISKNANLGFCNKFIDFALFTDKIIDNKNIKANRIEISADVKCLQDAEFEEKKDASGNNDMFILLPGAKVDFEEIGGFLKVKSMTSEIDIYDTWNKKNNLSDYKKRKGGVVTAETTKKIFFVNKYVIFENGQFKESQIVSNTPEKIVCLKKVSEDCFNILINQFIPYLPGNDYNGQELCGKCITINYSDVYIKKDDYNVWKNSPKYSYLFVKKFEQKGNFAANTAYNQVDYPQKKDYEEIDYSKKKKIPEKTICGETYNLVTIDKKNYYIKKSDVKTTEWDIAKEITSSFIKLNYGDNAFSDTNTFPDTQLYFKRESEVKDFKNPERYPDLKEKLKELVGKIDQKYKSYIGKNDNIYDFGEISASPDCSNYHELMEKCLKKITSKHPLEFHKDSIDEVNKQRLDFSGSNQITISDSDNIFSKLNSISKQNSFYFFCPPYFINQVEKYKPTSVNPYLGKKYSEIYNTPNDREPLFDGSAYEDNEVYSNPGMATVWPSSGVSVYFSDEDEIKYAGINGFFNADYTKVYGYKYWHEGVDFRGPAGTEVHSLINGIVVEAGRRTNGQGFILLKSLEESYIYYLALHVDPDTLKIKANEPVSPGMVLGYTMKINAPHLHVSAIKLLENQAADKIIYSKDKDNLFTFNVWKKEYWNYMINPFNHDDKNSWQGN